MTFNALNLSFKPWLVALLFAMMSPLTAYSDEAVNNQQEPLDKLYQQALYYYFQGDFYQALTQFSLLEQRFPGELKNVTNPGIEPELLKGGISLAYGLEQQATDIFSRLLAQNTDSKTHTYAWFLLGKSYHNKQQYLEAAKAFENITPSEAQNNLEGLNGDELVYLKSQLFPWLSDQQKQQSDWLAQLSSDSIYRDYVIYNQGLSQLQQGNYEQAVSSLTSLNTRRDSVLSSVFSRWWSPLQEVDAQEQRALSDRANLTLGYAHLQHQKSRLAIEAFTRVRLDSLDTQAAMLGYGWAATEKSEYRTAVSVWDKLQKMPQSSEYVLEAFLASAYAFEKAFAPTQAIAQLRLGLGRYQQEISSLQQVQQTIDDAFFIRVAESEKEKDESLLPGYLSNVMLSQDFRSQLNELRDSLQIESQLNQWKKRLAVFHLMLDERQQESVERAAKLKQSQFLDRLQRLRQRRDELARIVQKAGLEPQAMHLMSDPENAWQDRLDKAQTRFTKINLERERLGKKPLSMKYQDRLNRLKGAMLWNHSESFPQRLWSVRKALKQLDTSILKTSARQDILIGRLNAVPEYAEQRTRIAQIEVRLTDQANKNKALLNAQLIRMNGLFQQKLAQQLALLKNYQLQAQLAMVRLNDEAFRKAQAVERQGGQSNGH